MMIDCDTCAVRGPACGGCVMTVLMGAPPHGVELDDAEQAALSVLARSGLVPPLRLVGHGWGTGCGGSADHDGHSSGDDSDFVHTA